MRFLVDAQLPFRLAQYLQQMGVEAVHTTALPLANRTPDSELKRLSVEGSCVVVTKDSDFVDNLLLHDNVYKLLLVSTGNISNNELIALFQERWQVISEALGEARFVELTVSGLVVHW